VSEFIDWTETPEGERAQIPRDGEKRSEVECAEAGCDADGPLSWQSLPAHDFAERVTAEDELEPWEEGNWDQDPDLWLYRKKTTTLLRRYMRWSLEAGRVPSLLGRELFRARISAYSATTFEERVIFLHDIEVCLDRLKGFDRQIVARIVLQEHDHEAAARILQCDRKTIERRLPELIDELTEVFLQAGLLERLPESKEEAL
jgi:DNA-directed RNA polymerase specialized sigma24 family protein